MLEEGRGMAAVDPLWGQRRCVNFGAIVVGRVWEGGRPLVDLPPLLLLLVALGIRGLLLSLVVLEVPPYQSRRL